MHKETPPATNSENVFSSGGIIMMIITIIISFHSSLKPQNVDKLVIIDCDSHFNKHTYLSPLTHRKHPENDFKGSKVIHVREDKRLNSPVILSQNGGQPRTNATEENSTDLVSSKKILLMTERHRSPHIRHQV